MRQKSSVNVERVAEDQRRSNNHEVIGELGEEIERTTKNVVIRLLESLAAQSEGSG